MKIKKIMLITLLLFAVLTIGAVSAADDTVSENLTVTDEAASDNLAVDDAVANEEIIGLNYDTDHGIDVNTEIDLTDNDDTIADIYLPTNAKGSFKIFNGNEEVINLNVDENDEDHWTVDDDDGEEYLWGTIYLGDLNINKINTGDILSFKFFELNNEEYTLVDSFTVLGVDGYNKWTWENLYFPLIYIRCIYEKTFCFSRNSAYRLGKAVDNLSKEIADMEKYYFYNNISYNFLPEMLYNFIVRGIGLKEEREEISKQINWGNIYG